MAVVTPIGWLQNSGATNTASMMRLASGGAGKGSGLLTSLLAARGGVVRREPNMNMFLGQNGGGTMHVVVQPGLCYVPGTESLAQGGYWVANDASLTVGAFAASDPTNNRIDVVYVKVNDTIYSGALNSAQILIAQGNPLTPTTPASLAGVNNAFSLGRVTIRAGATTILTSDINNNARIFTAPGGVTVTRSDEASEVGSYPEDLSIFSKIMRRWDEPAQLWRPLGIPYAAALATVVNPETDQIAYLTTTRMFNRWTGSVWEENVQQTPRGRFRTATSQSFTGTYSTVNFPIEDKDTLNGHSTVTNTGRYTCQRNGDYRFTGGCSFAPNATGGRACAWFKNGTIVDGSGTELPVNSASYNSVLVARTTTIPMVVGDFVELRGSQNSGGGLTNATATSGQCSMEVEMVGW